ncbi:site-specific integrase [Pseudomonas sp. LS-2]|nr:site-specific integrase [Pseudomonas sp. LS-2]
MNNKIKSRARKNRFLTHRDLVILNLLRELGIRHGELLGITTDAFERKAQGFVTVKIRDNPDPSTDTRSNLATVKTGNRELKISDQTWTLVERYIKTRANNLKVNKHNFLIIGQSGKPLSNDAVNNLFNSLSKCLEKKITPHSFRHSWACNFILEEYEKASKATGPRKERIISAALSTLRAHMGWSLKSKMPEYYGNYAFQKLGNDRLIYEDEWLTQYILEGEPDETK